MPPWKIHNKYALDFGISREVSGEVNVWIDLGPVHDLGVRGVNKKKKWWMVTEIEEVERVILGRVYGYEENKDKLREIKKLREKQKEVEKVLLRIASSEEYIKAFILHHALDILCNDLAVSFEVLLRAFPSRKAAISSLKTQNFVKTLGGDLRLIRGRVRERIPIEESIVVEILYFLKDRLDEILSDVDVKEWITHVVNHRLKKKETPPNLNGIKKGGEIWMKKMNPIYRSVFPGDVEEKLLKYDAIRQATNSQLSRMTRWVLDRNNVWEVLRVSGHDLDSTSYLLNGIHKRCMSYLVDDPAVDFRTNEVKGLLKAVPEELSEAVIQDIKRDVELVKKSIEIR